MTQTKKHFTAWLTNDTSALDQSCMDLTILADELIGTDPEREDGWASNGPQVFYAVTTVDATDGDIKDGIAEAEELMSAAGWETAGSWDATPNAYTVTVRKREDDEG
jgi:hypothetical protein